MSTSDKPFKTTIESTNFNSLDRNMPERDTPEINGDRIESAPH